MTSHLDYCRKQRALELPKFVKVLKAMPQERLDYRPDPKARTAAELGWTLAEEEAALVSVLESGQCEWKQTPPPATVGEIVAAYERHATKVNALLAAIDEAGWQ